MVFIPQKTLDADPALHDPPITNMEVREGGALPGSLSLPFSVLQAPSRCLSLSPSHTICLSLLLSLT